MRIASCCPIAVYMVGSDCARTARWTSRRRIWTYFMQARDRDVRRIRHSSQGNTEHVRCGQLLPPSPAQNAVCCIFLPVILAEISSNIYRVFHHLSEEIVFFMKFTFCEAKMSDSCFCAVLRLRGELPRHLRRKRIQRERAQQIAPHARS